ncbi:MAG: polyribonucleotide nucleotidyltransferase [Patescibacteria group bacterium]
MTKIASSIVFGGKEITFETGVLANQASAAVLVSCQGTVVLATVVAGAPREDLDYFPLQVEYSERLYAGGKIKGSRWVKREGRPSDDAILSARLIDRSIRPLFPSNFNGDVQVIITVLSIDHQNDPVILGALAVSAALHISNIPWGGPLAFIRVSLDEQDKLVLGPSNEKLNLDKLDLIASVSKDGVIMLEGGAKQVTDDQFIEAIDLAQKESGALLDFFEDFRKKAGKEKLVLAQPDLEIDKKIEKIVGDRIAKLVDQVYTGENHRLLVDELIDQVRTETEGINANLIKEKIGKMFKKEFRKRILSGKRVDGRKSDELRSISAEVGLLPRTHGSGLFQRGETQALTVATLAGPDLKQLIENMEGEESKGYLHHYSMPPFATGETGRIGSPNRREIGHGALAEKALIPVLPDEKKFPYTIRLVSEILASNGSSSMASACGSTLALMDAGVPITDPVAGIAIGLVTDNDQKVVLTDIKGIEDFNGDMDFKVAGTKNGITAVQVDMKITGLSMDLVRQAMTQAKQARLQILETMAKAIPACREAVSQYAPKVAMTQIPIESIGELIGPGGRIIRALIEKSGCEISVENDGSVSVTGEDAQKVSQTIEEIDSMMRKPEPGEEFDGVVKRVESFGAFVEFLPGKDGLVHVSRMGKGFIETAIGVLTIGQQVKVRLNEVDPQGRYNLTLLEPVITGTERSQQPQPSRNFAERPQRRDFRPRR